MTHSLDASGDHGLLRGGRLAYRRAGAGEPLVLLHGQGMSHRAWEPVLPRLMAQRDVIVVDLPGHGSSARQPEGVGSTPADLAAAVAELLDELHLDSVHVAGNSSGGWVALELGRLHRAKSVTAISPAGLWSGKAPRHVSVAMRQVRLTARVVRRLAPNAPRHRLSSALCLLQASGRPFGVPAENARAAVSDLASAPGFRETLRGLESRRFEDGQAITVPVTVAFGSRDRVLLPVITRHRDQLPTQTEWVTLPGCGHIAMFDDADAVADLLLSMSRPDKLDLVRAGA